MISAIRRHAAAVGRKTRINRVLWIALVCPALLVASPAAFAQKASRSGTVLIEASGKPVPNAEILPTASKRSTRSDSDGNFKLADLPAAKHDVLVRVVGFSPFTTTVTLAAGMSFEADFGLVPTTTKLDTLEVSAARPPSRLLAEFEERRRTGQERFITADVFEKEAGRPLSSFIAARIPGLKVLAYKGEHMFTTLRGAQRPVPRMGRLKQYPDGRYARVVLNGVVVFDGSFGQDMFDMDRMVSTRDIIGLEFHTVATTPVQYNQTSGFSCGTVIIWTR